MTQGIFSHIEAEGIEAEAPALHRHKRVTDNAAALAVAGMVADRLQRRAEAGR